MTMKIDSAQITLTAHAFCGNELFTDKQQSNTSTGFDNSADKINDVVWRGGQVKHSLLATTAASPLQQVKAPERFAEGFVDLAYDGLFIGEHRGAYSKNSDFNSIPVMQPMRGSKHDAQKVIYINGINNDKSDQGFTMRGIAEVSGQPVVGIHNSTEGMKKDLEQCWNDKKDLGRNLAVSSLTRTVLSELKQNRTVHIMGHSQGGLIAARSLFHVKKELISQALAKGLSSKDAQISAERQMSKINVETFGAASGKYPDGPRYVHYINYSDNVPMRLGLGDGTNPKMSPGKGAVIRRFNAEYLSQDKLNPQLNDKFVAPHSVDDVYLKFRQPFNQARSEGGNRFMPGPVNGAVTRPGFIIHQKP